MTVADVENISRIANDFLVDLKPGKLLSETWECEIICKAIGFMIQERDLQGDCIVQLRKEKDELKGKLEAQRQQTLKLEKEHEAVRKFLRAALVGLDSKQPEQDLKLFGCECDADELELEARSANCLGMGWQNPEHGIKVRDIALLSDNDLLKKKGIGKRTLNDIRACIEMHLEDRHKIKSKGISHAC